MAHSALEAGGGGRWAGGGGQDTVIVLSSLSQAPPRPGGWGGRPPSADGQAPPQVQHWTWPCPCQAPSHRSEAGRARTREDTATSTPIYDRTALKGPRCRRAGPAHRHQPWPLQHLANVLRRGTLDPPRRPKTSDAALPQTRRVPSPPPPPRGPTGPCPVPKTCQTLCALVCWHVVKQREYFRGVPKHSHRVSNRTERGPAAPVPQHQRPHCTADPCGGAQCPAIRTFSATRRHLRSHPLTTDCL